MHLIFFLPFYIILSLVGWIDCKSYIIPNRYIGVFLLYACFFGIFVGPLWPFSSFLMISILSLAPLMIGRFLGRMILLGWGDIKLMGVCALVLPLEYLGVFCILTGLFGLLYRWIFAPNTLIPFAPSIGLAFFAVTLWMGVSEKDLFFSSI